jgi:small subunit ribosomal protein S4
MARRIGAVCRLCRREGVKLFLKGNRCVTEKCSFDKRGYSPGQHGQGRRIKLSDYGMQLREKQKVKRIYGLLEKQFRSYFHKAEKQKGVTGEILLQLLERRLDNVIFQSGFAASRPQARQIVRHKLVMVNGRKVNIPSYLVRKDDVVRISGDNKTQKMASESLKESEERALPEWIVLDKGDLSAKISRLPQREDIAFPVQEQLIVELYSK